MNYEFILSPILGWLTALAVTCLLCFGIASVEFAISAVVALVVTHDAFSWMNFSATLRSRSSSVRSPVPRLR